MEYSLSNFQMNVVKTSISPSGERKIRLSASDTGEDVFEERMSLELFSNFIRRIEQPVEGVWKSVLTEKSGWSGGMPYTSVSHYPSGVDGKNVPADVVSVYVDGHVLKSIAVVRNTPLGDALWESLRADADGTSDYDDKVRVSIGFIDLKHRHGDFIFERKTLADKCPMCQNGVGNKTYLDGILVHEAFTRVPANPRTDVEVEKMASKIKTVKDDAESIVGKVQAEELEVNKSTALPEDVLVVKSEEPAEEVPAEEPVVEKAEMKEDEEEQDEEYKEKKKKGKKEDAPVEKSEIEQAFDILQEQIEQHKSLPRQEALEKIQPAFDALGAAVQGQFVEPELKSITATIDPALNEVLTSIANSVNGLVEKVNTLSDEVTIIKSQRVAAPVVDETPKPRNLQVNRAITNEPLKPLSIQQLADRSVGLNR
jgi:hypothetical protein